MTIDIPQNYIQLLKDIKEKVKNAQIKAAVKVNQELVLLYWEIGHDLVERQEKEGWGAKIIEKLSKDLKASFPNMKGFSTRNLKYMVKFAKNYPDKEIVQQLVAQIPWGHNIALMEKIETKEERIWYIKKTIENSWSRNVLTTWIESRLYDRQGKAITNFSTTLPAIQSDLANQTLKDPYCFDFLTLRERFDERELEDGLLDHIQRFLLELGSGFSFVGRQIHLDIGDQDFYLDLLFYHYKLRCFVVVELKATEFKPEHAGKMNFYLTAVDETLKHPDDKPTIGLLLCKNKNKIIAEYALRDIQKPLGVAGYETKIIESLPEDLKGSLPTIKEIEQTLEGEEE